MDQHPESKLTEAFISTEYVKVQYIETQSVKLGVECDVYSIGEDDKTMDLAIVRVQPGHSTPLQLVKSGIRTTEIFTAGSGKLTVTDSEGVSTEHSFTTDSEPLAIDILVGETMQWTANPEDTLVFYEVCEPPYQDGRFEDLV